MVMGSDMRTHGVSFAQFLYLLGIRPIWQKGSGRVLGLEAMSIAELKRPRIDATARITGMMRDSMPCVVTLLDKAVKLAASLDESDEINYISKHLKEDIEYLEQQGIVKEEAAKQAVHRIFGCPPVDMGQEWRIYLKKKTGKRSMTWHKSMFVGGHMFMAMVRMEPICRICLNAG